MAYYSKYPVTAGNGNGSDLWHKNKHLLKSGKTSVEIVAHLEQLPRDKRHCDKSYNRRFGIVSGT